MDLHLDKKNVLKKGSVVLRKGLVRKKKVLKLDSPCKAGALALFHFGVQLLVITVNIQFQSQPTSQNVMF